MDEEGYSIRPDDAAKFGTFPDDPSASKKDNSDSDSDFGDGEIYLTTSLSHLLHSWGRGGKEWNGGGERGEKEMEGGRGRGE